VFKNFVSASPSLWYNNFYLNQLPDKLKQLNDKDSIEVFLSVGSLEDSVWGISPVKALAKQIRGSGLNNITLQSRIYNDLDHMDVAQLSFIQGLQQFYNKKEK
jgi:predicted alpha/beta superfamily hydrolase